MNIVISFIIGNMSGLFLGVMLMCVLAITKGGDE